MDVHPWLWFATIGGLVAIMLIDIFIIGRRPHEPSMKEAGIFVGVYVSLAVLFGIGVWLFSGHKYGGEFFAGWLTEYTLSIDNLFIFIIIMARFNVPRRYQQTALLVGIVLALIMRGIFIAVGAVAINAWAWIFYIFGAFLIYTAVQLARHKDEEDSGDNALIRFATRHLSATNEYRGMKMTIVEGGQRLVTPMFMVILALGMTDLLFALDSIPAIFGLTQEPYLVWTANVFALMGLRQLYFLLGGLLQRLVFLSYGLAVILAFIGVKLILHALHENNLAFINNGEGLHVPEISTAVSLGMIVVTIAATTVLSLLHTRRTNGKAADATAAGLAAADSTESGDQQPAAEDDATTSDRPRRQP